MKTLFYLFVILVFSQMVLAQNFPVPSNANHSGGTYSIYRYYDNTITINNLRKALIWVEGFETLQDVSIGQNYDILNNSSFGTQIHDAGYDIVILNFNFNSDDIRRNARVLKDLIGKINQGKPNNEPLVIMGYSMGGLVARYALVEMENQNIDHQTRLYISYDAPHKGAHIPVSVQALAATFNSQTYKNLYPDIATLIDRFNSPAATQMLKFRVPGATGPNQTIPVSTGFTTFFDELNGLNSNGGFPINCQSVGLSLGSWSGIPQRANFDSDGDGKNDFQHSGFPSVYVNFPQDQYSGSTSVWNLNACQAVAAFAFQNFLSTASSTTYPYYSSRSSYLDLQNWVYATYWYRNSSDTQLLPAGAWSNFYNYENDEAIDFVPGSFANTYAQVVNTLNSQIHCSFSYYDNNGFISTVSALAFNTDSDNIFSTDDLFYRIGDDANRLSKTKFADIFAFCGENNSHTDLNTIATDPNLIQWVMNKINGRTTAACYCGSTSVISGPSLVCNTGGTFTMNNLPPGSAVTWSQSSNLSYVSGQGTANYTVSESSGGSGWVNAFVTGSCGASPTVQINVWAGAPSADISTLIYPAGKRGVNPVTLGTGSLYNFKCDPVSSATSFTWVLPSGFSFYSGGTTSSPWINTSSTNGSYTMYCSANNLCGSAWTHNLGITISGGGGGAGPVKFTAYPNPTSSNLTIQVTDSTEGKSLDQPYQLNIMDRFARKVYSIQSSEETFEIPVNNLPPDIYYLNLIYKDVVLQKQIVIKR